MEICISRLPASPNWTEKKEELVTFTLLQSSDLEAPWFVTIFVPSSASLTTSDGSIPQILSENFLETFLSISQTIIWGRKQTVNRHRWVMSIMKLKLKGRKGREQMVGWGYFKLVVRGGHTNSVAFDQNPKEGRTWSVQLSGRSAFQEEETAKADVLREKHVGWPWGAERRAAQWQQCRQRGEGSD